MRKQAIMTLAASTIMMGMAVPAQAQPSANFCNQVESIGQTYNRQIVAGLNDRVAGYSHKINRRKTLKVHQVNWIKVNRCDLSAQLKVTLQRKIRRDAHGNVNVKARITSANLDRVCFDQFKVTDVDLSRTLGVGESVYKFIANRRLPNNGCISLR